MIDLESARLLLYRSGIIARLKDIVPDALQVDHCDGPIAPTEIGALMSRAPAILVGLESVLKVSHGNEAGSLSAHTRWLAYVVVNEQPRKSRGDMDLLLLQAIFQGLDRFAPRDRQDKFVGKIITEMKAENRVAGQNLQSKGVILSKITWETEIWFKPEDELTVPFKTLLANAWTVLENGEQP